METGEYETNTLIINDISAIQYRVYESSSEHSHAFVSTAVELERALRDRGYIASYDPNRRAIWTFRLCGKDEANDAKPADTTLEVSGHVLVQADEGTLEPQSLQRNRALAGPSAYTPTSSSSSGSALEQRAALLPPSQPPGTNTELDSKNSAGNDPKSAQNAQTAQKSVYENFVLAILFSVTYSFCRHTGALPLNYRTVLMPDDDADSELDRVLGDFRVHLTTAGTLLINLSLHYCKGLQCLGNIVAAGSAAAGQPILAAPLGIFPYKQHAGDGSASLAHTPSTQILSLRNGAESNEFLWKEACLKYLELRGLSSSRLTNCHWVNVFVSKRRLQDAKRAPQTLYAAHTAAIPWPGPLCFRRKVAEVSTTTLVGETMLSGHEETHDPIGYAGGWLASSADREEKLTKRKHDRAVPKETNGAEQPKPTAHSPLAFRQPSTTAAAGAMYLTPPDGMQQLNGMPPSLDGTVSSPSNPLPNTTIPDAAPPVEDTFNQMGVAPEPKRERSDSNLLDTENMFGDIGEDMFGDNDITEADFNFFDEQPGDLDLSMELDAMESEQPTPVVKEEEPPVEESAPPVCVPEPVPEVVFTKPELRHARSTLTDSKPNDSRLGSAKRDSSPFDSQTVFKRVRASLMAKASSPNRKDFAKIELGPAVSLINKKYEKGGLFHHEWLPRPAKALEPVAPKTAYLQRHGGSGTKRRDRLASSMLKALPDAGNPTLMAVDDQSDADSSVASDQDDSSYTSDEPGSPIKSSVKPATIEDDVMSQVTSVREAEPIEEVDHAMATELPRLSKPEAPEISLVRLFSDTEPFSLDHSITDQDVVLIGQLLAEQASTGNLHIGNLARNSVSDLSTGRKRQVLASTVRNAMEVLERAVPPLAGGAVISQLKGLLDAHDVPLMGHPNRLQPRPVPGRDEQTRPNNLYQIPGPHLEVRRADTKLSVLPSAVTFWESLGLGPSSGGKDVRAICVFPGWKGLADNVQTFLDRMKSVYEMLKLGSFENAPLPGDLRDGILPYEVDRISTSPDATLTAHGSGLVESVETLRAAVSELEATQVNVLVYFVYSPNNPSTIIESCLAFQRLFESYQKVLAARRETPKIELVLQLTSIDLLSSPAGLVVTPPSDLSRICMEIYDRCTLFTGPMPAPAIKLGQSLPRQIEFKLMNPPSASLLHENSCIHVAYAQSIDDRWVTTAWTDDRGNQQATAAYCLARRGKPLSLTMHDVAHHIWESTLDLISFLKVHWRVIITKCSPMEQSEVDFWLDLARTEIKANVTVTLLTVDTAPSLQLIPPTVRPPQSAMSFYSTPVSTPQASMVSPEQSGTPATPIKDGAATPAAEGGDNEADAVLVDVTDQTWGAITAHRLSNSTTILDVQPTLASGYLIKRSGIKIEEPPAVMEVNLIHTDNLPRSPEVLFREILSNFRNLGTLARARGVVEREADVRPWHVAAAEKALKVLYLLM
ncbi:mediator complex subunit 13 C-terminal-domain-containing protein [Stachybotrys elegans]|uniref:Mediator of RNA polymerase II transcription subunit 13 n=1 Tax=Stachybotrys elegans TaxID=80388 RepID=A0A8K0SSS2_9HYPO|nr:mediator complex subunit 13 C-terminal-domain-containing protein [Stachybotrys elegans]